MRVESEESEGGDILCFFFTGKVLCSLVYLRVFQAEGIIRQPGERRGKGRQQLRRPAELPLLPLPLLKQTAGDHFGKVPGCPLRRHEEELILLEVPEEELTDVDTQEALRELTIDN